MIVLFATCARECCSLLCVSVYVCTVTTTPVPALTLLRRMSDNDSETKEVPLHPYVLLRMDKSIGVPAAFADGTLKWTDSMTGGRSSDKVLLDKARELMRAHTNGEPLEVRRALLGSMFAGQYNAPGAVFYCNYFHRYTQRDDGKPIILKAEAIEALVEANVPFAPWDVFVMFISEMRDTFLGVEEDDLPPVTLDESYAKFLSLHPFNAFGAAPGRPASVSSRNAIVNCLFERL